MTMSTTTIDAAAIAADIAARFERAWNAGDGAAYTEPLTPDADYVTIQGLHLDDRDDMTAGIAELYATIYRDSTMAIEPTRVRLLGPGTIVAQLRHVLTCPVGPLAGTTTTLATVVIVDTDDGWRVAALHNTVVAPPPEE